MSYVDPNPFGFTRTNFQITVGSCILSFSDSLITNLLTLHFVDNSTLITWSPGLFKVQTAVTVGFSSCKNLTKVRGDEEMKIGVKKLTGDSFYC